MTVNRIFINILQLMLNATNLCDFSCFEIIDYANTEYEIKLKEGMHIHWLIPKIDKQIMKSYKMTLSV